MKYQATHVMDTPISLTVTVFEAQRILEQIDELDNSHWTLLELRGVLVEGLTKTAERMQEHGAYLQQHVVKGYEDDNL